MSEEKYQYYIFMANYSINHMRISLLWLYTMRVLPRFVLSDVFQYVGKLALPEKKSNKIDRRIMNANVHLCYQHVS